MSNSNRRKGPADVILGIKSDSQQLCFDLQECQHVVISIHLSVFIRTVMYRKPEENMIEEEGLLQLSRKSKPDKTFSFNFHIASVSVTQ